MAIGKRTNNKFKSIVRTNSLLSNDSVARKFSSLPVSKNTAIGVKNDSVILNNSLSLSTLSTIATSAAELSKTELEQVKLNLSQIINNRSIDEKGALVNLNIDGLSNQKISQINLNIKDLPTELRNKTENLTSELLKNKVGVFLKNNKLNVDLSKNISTPEIDHISVDVDKKRGVIDCFYTHIVYSVKLDELSSQNISSIKIFRSEINTLKTPILSRIGVDKIRTGVLTNKSKNSEIYNQQITNKLVANNIENAISKINPIDPVLNTRISLDGRTKINNTSFNSGFIGLSDGGTNQQKDISSFISPEILKNLDKSVTEDINFINRISRNNSEFLSKIDLKVNVGKTLVTSDKLGSQHINDLGSINDNLISSKNNNFKQIAQVRLTVPTSKINATNGRIVGDHVEYSYDDETVEYGKVYQYYLIAVDSGGNESVRSRIVNVSIEGLRVPEAPRRVLSQIFEDYITFLITVKDKLVEKFEIYRKEINSIKNDVSISNVISAANGLFNKRDLKVKLKNGFTHIGEVFNLSSESGGTFIDYSIKAGTEYIYRVYSVDIFGNKSETPNEVKVFIPDFGKVNNNLLKTKILVEVDSTTNKAKITYQNEDKRVVALYLSRRDLTIGEKAFTSFGQSNFIKLGNSRNFISRNNMEDIKYIGSSELMWNGVFFNDTVQHVFIDSTVQLDHVYQYKIYGIDRTGNKSSYSITQPILISSKPIINEPINLKTQLIYTDDGILTSLKLSWQDGNLDITAEDRLGNRETLKNTEVRTLFQIERKRQGEDSWKSFPMTEGLEYTDLINNGQQIQKFMPDALEKGSVYAYRVKAMQTGSFISNYSLPVEAFIDAPVLAPINFKITIPDTKVRPFWVALNWDSEQLSGVIDHWEIQRSEVNNLASDSLVFKNSKNLSNLKFIPYRTVYSESSRFKSTELNDKTEGNIRSFNEKLLIGQHYFIDTNILFGNSYYYRIRSVSTMGQASEWTYKAVKISDDVFEKKQDIVINQKEKELMTNTLLPVVFKGDLLSAPIEKQFDSFSLLPNFSTPALNINLPSVPQVDLSVQNLTSTNTLINSTLQSTNLNLISPSTSINTANVTNLTEGLVKELSEPIPILSNALTSNLLVGTTGKLPTTTTKLSIK